MTKILNTWSPLSNVTVRLKFSRDYLRLIVFVHAVAAIAVFQSACPVGLVCALAFALAAHASYLWRQKTPGVLCSELHYWRESWSLLDDTTGELVAYSEVQVRFDFGWLMWLAFKNPSRRDVFVFQDQLLPDEHRLLRLALRVNNKRANKS